MKEVVNFDRKELFKHYNEMDNPFIIMTIPLNVTKVVEYCKLHKHFYATLGFLIGKAANDIDGFKYRYNCGKFYYYDRLVVNFTERVDNQIGFFECEAVELSSFIDEFELRKSELGHYNDVNADNRQDVIWVSCFPWAKFSGLMSPHDKNITIPQFIWDKYELVDNEYYCNLMIMVHHGFIDGYHVGTFIEKLNQYINELQ